MADVTTIDAIHGQFGKIVILEFTKANATDTIAVPTIYGKTCISAWVQKKSTGVADPATAISANVVTLSVGTGSMIGIFVMSDS